MSFYEGLILAWLMQLKEKATILCAKYAIETKTRLIDIVNNASLITAQNVD